MLCFYERFYTGHTYHICAFAINTIGVAYGDDVTPTGGSTGGGDTDPIPIGCKIIEVKDDIKTVTMWTAGNVYVVKSWIDIDAPLTAC
jgi:hypothetical protein